MTQPASDLPLQGCVVIDLTAIVLGPLATLCLADFGAEIIKIEPPEGDAIRNAGASRNPGMGSIFLALNRNKKSVAIDLKREEGQEILRRLVARADVMVHNMRPEAAARLGVDAASVHKQNPKLIYCSASGFAETSERAGDPAVDDVIQAASGIASLFAVDGEPPRYVPALLADKVAGLVLCQAILGALLSRARTGRGQAINIPMFETLASFSLLEHMAGLSFVPPNGPANYIRLVTPHRRPMKTKDGYMAFTPYSKNHWQSFFRAAGRGDLCNDPRVTDARRRSQEIADLYALVAELLPLRTTREWMAIAREDGIPAAPVNDFTEIVTSGALREQGYLTEVDHPSEGNILAIGPFARLEGVSERNLTPAPGIGHDSQSILEWLGYSGADRRQLSEAKVVFG